MIHDDRQAAADQHRKEEKIEEVTVPDPHRKAVRARCRRITVWKRRLNVRQAEYCRLTPRHQHWQPDQHQQSPSDRRLQPDPEATVGRTVNGLVRRIEGDHTDTRAVTVDASRLGPATR